MPEIIDQSYLSSTTATSSYSSPSAKKQSKSKQKKKEQSYITIDVSKNSSNTPLGMQLAPITLYDHSFVTIAGWDHLPNTKKLGIIQKSGLVRLGDILVLINNVSVDSIKSFRRVMDLLKSLLEQQLLVTLTFCPSRVYYDYLIQESNITNNNRTGSSRNNNENNIMNKRGRYVFFSTISHYRIVEQDHPNHSMLTILQGATATDEVEEEQEEQTNYSNLKNTVSPSSSSLIFSNPQTTSKYVEYQVSCYLLLRGTKEEEIRWTVWKRFSQFKTLDKTLQTTYGWQMNAISSQFPSSYFMKIDRFSDEFCEKRCCELDNYWQALLQIDEMTDFTQSHRYSRDLADFLNVMDHLHTTADSMRHTHNEQENILMDSSLLQESENHSQDEKDEDNKISFLSQEQRRSRRNLGMTSPTTSTKTLILGNRDDHIIEASGLMYKKIIPLQSTYERRLHLGLFSVGIMYPASTLTSEHETNVDEMF